jgi:hypothetical protein
VSERTIDFSRYRVAEAIYDLWEAGENVEDIAEEFFPGPGDRPLAIWLIELVIAAHDRKGKYEPKVSA